MGFEYVKRKTHVENCQFNIPRIYVWTKVDEYGVLGGNETFLFRK